MTLPVLDLKVLVKPGLTGGRQGWDGPTPIERRVFVAAGFPSGRDLVGRVMDMDRPRQASRYLLIDRTEWAELGTRLKLGVAEPDLDALRGVDNPVSLADVTEVYLPLARLLKLRIMAARQLSSVVETGFLGRPRLPVPYVIAIAGSVAVGKSTFARVLQAVLAQCPDHPRVDLVTTDGFLLPRQVLEQRGLMRRKGFPESYDLRQMLDFLGALKDGMGGLRTPVYSHETYDIIPDHFQTVDRPDILIFEGLNVLQTASQAACVASDYFDFSIYLDAEPANIEGWFIQRFLLLQRTAFQKPISYFQRFKDLTVEQATDLAGTVWRQINLPNLLENIRPTRDRADLVVRLEGSHRIESLWLRRR